ncbi:protoporphyrinogen IX and coproporphyrinogen III oxidase [Candidatus Methylomirabilis lanthanidiphila]|uniref:Coproporphyrinogen III oxidase n=1 Tax=Candidatus Methylomirabilis lanthanidiphila TaxID=2211376 RepID=A0A564ZKB0_9BACT|nr:protoporphyrinogen oxidase [Candidatus Methylomirabilis lanthanidiphila]VUZ85734.1 protoporphyrinogen IX and coproporphyrinogen III oxidase [Candidatus Methylomirabilis lanthanidiphila]
MTTTQQSGSKRIVVVGSGIAGLAAAHRLQERRERDGLPCEVRVLEAAARPGGAISTTHRDGFILESGPDTIFTDKPWGLDLIRRLGLGDQIIGTSEAHRRTFVARGGVLYPLPEGFALIGPTRIWPFVRSGLLSWSGKARAGLDLVLPRGRAADDESLASFVRRRFGREFLDRLAQPMIGGIYGADPERLSLRATFPQFLKLEATHRSVILGLRRARPAGRGTGHTSSGPRYGLFVTLDNGLQAFVDALADRLPSGTLQLGASVVGIAHTEQGWTIRLAGGTSLQADSLILAIPAFQIAGLTRDLDRDLARQLEAVPYASSVTINLAYRREAIQHPLDGFGFVVPACEGRTIIACSFSSVKFAHRAPAGHVLLRAFAGGALQPEPCTWDDERLLSAVRRDLEELLAITAPPLWSQLVRHARVMPQYQVGHLTWLTTLEETLQRWPTLKLAGNAYRGVGVPDVIHSGEMAADSLMAALASAPTEPAPACAKGDSHL